LSPNSNYLAGISTLDICDIYWPSYDHSLVRRGEILFSYDFLDTWDAELERMNNNKMGKPFLFPNSFILAIGYIRYSFHLPYRQTDKRIIRATGKNYLQNQVTVIYVKG
jgi:hypothetical protein